MFDSVKNYFTKSAFSCMCDMMEEGAYIDTQDDDAKMEYYINLIVLVVISVGVLIYGFLAVPKLCPDTSERGKNTRLGLYALLLFTGGQIGILYIILSMANVNLCT